MQEQEPTAGSGAERFGEALRAQARVGYELSTVGADWSAQRDERAADALVRDADAVRSRLSPEQLKSLDKMSDGGVGALAIGARLLAFWTGRGDD